MRGLTSLVLGSLLVVILVALMVSGSATAVSDALVCVVEVDGSGTHASIQAAVDDVNCDIVNLGSGNFAENVTIGRSVTIQGQSASSTPVVGGCCSGRALTVQSEAAVTLSGLTIRNGTGRFGVGGIENHGKLTLTYCVVNGNGTITGGTIYNSGTLTITYSTISGNKTDSDAGGIYNNLQGALLVSHSTISGNTAFGALDEIDGYGGGLLNHGTAIIRHSTVSSNSAYGWGEGGGKGGGIYNSGTMTVSFSTISGNGAYSDGGGIYNTGTLSAHHTIIANNSGGGDCSGAITSLGFNIDGDDTCDLDRPGDQANTNPLLGPLQHNGGPTWTHALLPGSPAIDKGSDLTCPSSDQRGYPRPIDGDRDGWAASDIGSYEYSGFRGFIPFVMQSRILSH